MHLKTMETQPNQEDGVATTESPSGKFSLTRKGIASKLRPSRESFFGALETDALLNLPERIELLCGDE